MHIIGVTGPIGSGKTALIEAILEAEPTAVHAESGKVIAEVADVLNQDLLQRPELVTTYDNPLSLKPWLDEALPTALIDTTSQAFDADLLRISPKHIADNPLSYAKLDDYMATVKDNPEDVLGVTITDDNKETYRPFLQWIGGYVTTKLERSVWYEELISRSEQAAEDGTTLYIIGGVRFPLDADVVRTAGGSIIGILRPDTVTRDETDPTERERVKIKLDSLVENDASLVSLQAVGRQLARDVARGKLHDEYVASACDPALDM